MNQSILDACCFINLYATGEIRGFLQAGMWSWNIPSAALAESLYIWVPNDQGQVQREPIPSRLFVDEGLIKTVDVCTDEEVELYVRLAAELDDGEAMGLAISKRRQWILATDDRKAKRLALELGVLVMTTPELMQRWADAEDMSAARISALLRNIESRACFVPARNSAGYDWWTAHAGEPPSSSP